MFYKVKMIAPENVTGASIDGKEYKVKDSKIKAEPEHAAKLIEMGFIADGYEEEEKIKEVKNKGDK